MSLSYFLRCSLLSGGLVGTALAALAQPAVTDSARATPPRLLLKTGLRLTHLSYSPGRQTWQLIVPASAGAEYRLTPRFSIYSFAEADLQASHLVARHRQVPSAIPSAGLSMGLRYYYDQPRRPGPYRAGELYGNYVALEGSVERDEVAARYVNQLRQQLPTSLTPSVYALWGTQHQFRRFVLYDLNAGLGIQTPPYYSFERVGSAHYDVAVQVNIRIYYSLGF